MKTPALKSKYLFCGLLLSTQSSFAALRDLPYHPRFIPITSSSERPLGSGYTQGLKGAEEFCKQGVVQQIGGGDPSVITESNNVLSHTYLYMDNKTKKSTTEVKSNTEVSDTLKLGKALLDSKMTSQSDTLSTDLILFSYYSPKHERIDSQKCELSKIKNFAYNEKNSFSFMCDFYGNTQKISPVMIPEQARRFLSSTGVRVINEHYYGLSYFLSASLRFQSESDKINFSKKINGTFPKANGEMNLDIAQNHQTSHFSIDVNLDKNSMIPAFNALKNIGKNHLVEEIDELEEKLLLQAQEGNIQGTIKMMIALSKRIENVQQEIYALEQNGVKISLPVIAAGLSYHNNCTKEIQTIERCIQLSFNKVFDRQTAAEKKQKSSKW
ncbi:MAG: hypothetical protein AB8C84_12455 [Oligoflexales bacterium]